jgi:hypothetical protein
VSQQSTAAKQRELERSIDVRRIAERTCASNPIAFGLPLAGRSTLGVSAMKHRALIVTHEENVWWVRLDGVVVVSFSGPHAQQWAYREREELSQLLEAQLDSELDEQHSGELDEQYYERCADLKFAGRNSANSLRRMAVTP